MDNRYLFRGKQVDIGEWVIGTPREQVDKTYILPLDYDIIFDRPDYPALGCGVEDIGVQRNGYLAAEYGFDEALGRYEEQFPAWQEIDPATLGQCSGLTAAKSYRGDRPDDKLIWESDIVKTKEYGRDDEKGHNWNDYDQFIVKWHEGRFVIENETRRFGLTDNPRIYEIIGTIHDRDVDSCKGEVFTNE